MKVSIVTVCFNSERGILSTLESVRNQTYADIEHIVKDGGSRDGTVDLIRAHQGPNVRLISEKDGGIYEAINAGLSYTSGDVLGLLHSEDTFAYPDVVTLLVRKFQEGFDVIYGDLNYVTADGSGKIIREWKAGPYKPGLIRRGWMPPHPTVYMTRDLFERVGLYRTDYRIASDYDYMIRLFSKSRIRIGYLPHLMVNMKVGGASNKNLKSLIRKSKEDFDIMMRHQFGLPRSIMALIYKNTSKIRQFF